MVVQDRKVIGNGFNGVASGKQHCVDGGCPRGQLSYSEVPAGADYNAFPCYAVHAEHNAILQAGLERCLGATIYVTDAPCQQCMNLIEHAKIDRIVLPPKPPGPRWTEWQTPEDKRINLLEGFDFMGDHDKNDDGEWDGGSGTGDQGDEHWEDEDE